MIFKKMNAYLLLALIFIFPSTAFAQMGSKRNPGSILPEWWNEREYIPEILDGARHIRMGNAGFSSPSHGVLGRSNCDINLLYYSRSKTSMPKEELDECALSEYHIHKGVTGEQVNLGDGFEKQEVIAKFSKILLDRLETFKNTDYFYFRSFGFKLEPYDFNKSAFYLKVIFNSSSDHKRVIYSFSGPEFEPLNSVYATGFELSPESSRRLEASRASNKILTPTNKIVFKVRSVKESPSDGKKIFVDVDKFEFKYLDKSGNEYKLGFGS